MSRCPICGRSATPRAENAAFPFCSARCRQIDLGKWLSEEYRVPAVESETDGGIASERLHHEEKP
jgi:endogenous inhibitor of DNA gyrase (YacG/DUF329 family)